MCAAAAKEHVTEGKGDIDCLIADAAFYSCILEVFVGGVAGFVHKLQEPGEIAGAECLGLLLRALVIQYKVHGAHKGAVAAGLADLSSLVHELLHLV